MRARVRRAVAAALGESVADASSLAGGDINDAYQVTLASGRTVFVKTNDTADPRMFPCEADGLAWLAEPGCVRVPEVLAVRGADSSADSAADSADSRNDRVFFLALEYIAAGRPASDYHERLGRGLAELHLSGAESFGLKQDNFIATIEQANEASSSWPDFYATKRLAPLVERAIAHGRAPATWHRNFADLARRMTEDDLCGPPEPPARLHGDLWSGNVHTDKRGQPCLIDPAVYGGHREIDLAMLALFGGLNDRMRDAYHERYPLAPGYAQRMPLYQLYPLLVHVVLFGGSYVSSVESALRRYL